MRRLNFDIMDAVVTPYTPVVSTAVGSNLQRAKYFRSFDSSTFRAAYPGATAESQQTYPRMSHPSTDFCS